MKNTITQHLKNKTFHLIGIGGAGMMGIAELLHNLGFSVTGSDIVESSTIKRLRKLKIKIYIGHKTTNLKQADIVIYSNAIKKNNIEFQFAKANALTILSRMEILSELMRLSYGISVTGSHGKTTTTSLLSHILYKNNLDPTYLIGGKLKTDDPHVKLGESNYLIAETDESDPSFINLKPHLIVLTNLDHEHLENYRNSYINLERSMINFINSIPFYGSAFINGDDPHTRKIIKKLNRNTFTYGFNKDNALKASKIKYKNQKMTFELSYDNKSYIVNTNLYGEHNVYNILAAISVCIHLDIKISNIIKSVSSFFGARRRFDIYRDIKINNKTIKIIDDYGHHPTEILSTIKTINEIFPTDKIMMVFQPHRFSRTKSSWRSLVKVLMKTNSLLLLPTYSAGEKRNSYNSKFLFNKIKNKNKVLLTSLNGISKKISFHLNNNTILLLQGAGDIRDIISIIKKDND